MSLGLEVSALTDSGEHTDVQTDQISPVFYGTSSLWGCCPAYQSLHHNHESQKKVAKRHHPVSSILAPIYIVFQL